MFVKKNLRTILLIAVILIGISCTFFIEIPNFSPLGAVCLLGAAYFANKKYAFILPVALMWLVHLYLNNVVYAEYFDSFELVGVPSVYLSIVLMVLIGTVMLKKINFTNVMGSALVAAFTFYLVTNFFSWLGNPLYPRNFAGLMESYTAAIPFFRSGTLPANLIFTPILFGIFELLDKKVVIPYLAKNPISIGS